MDVISVTDRSDVIREEETKTLIKNNLPNEIFKKANLNQSGIASPSRWSDTLQTITRVQE